jgi:hypothetical protein
MIQRLKNLWMQAAVGLGRINSAILLSLLFFFVLTPIGLLLRLLGRSPLASPPTGSSLWHPIDDESDARKPF